MELKDMRGDVIEALQERLAGYDDIAASDEKVQAFLNTHSPKEIFMEYCEWNGIIGYSDTLFEIVLSLTKK